MISSSPQPDLCYFKPSELINWLIGMNLLNGGGGGDIQLIIVWYILLID